MALRSDRNPYRDEIKAEFGANTLAGITTSGSLNAMHEAIFGAGSHNRNDFRGYGKPTVSSFTASPVTGQKQIQLSFYFTHNNLTGTIRFRYSNDNFVSDDNYGGSITRSSTGTVNHTLNMPNWSTQYWFKLEVYNDFNSNTLDWTEYGTPSATVVAQPKHPTPTITGVNKYSAFAANFSLIFNSTVDPSTANCQLGVIINSVQTESGTLSYSTLGGAPTRQSGVYYSNRTAGGQGTITCLIRILASNGYANSDWASYAVNPW